jgi:hypothetical protein
MARKREKIFAAGDDDFPSLLLLLLLPLLLLLLLFWPVIKRAWHDGSLVFPRLLGRLVALDLLAINGEPQSRFPRGLDEPRISSVS